MTTFDGNLLKSGFQYTVDGLQLSITSDGSFLTNDTGAGEEGVWLGQFTDTAGVYTLDFSQPVSEIEIDFLALNSFASPIETISNFQTSLGAGAKVSATVELINPTFLTLKSNVLQPTSEAVAGVFSSGTITYSGSPFDKFSIFFEQNGNNAGTVITNVETDKAPVLFLDFGNAIARDFTTGDYVDSDGNVREGFSYGAGTEPLSNYTDAQKAAIVSGVQAIFDRSDLGVSVVDDQPQSGDFHSVRFTSTVLAYDPDKDPSNGSTILLGIAYEGIDQYNAKPSDTVAVFATTNFDLALMVETIAHEAAHSFGVRHVNPVSGTSTEVMDYHDSASPQFANTVAKITEPPSDGEVATNVTHNPTYHIGRYVLGKSDAELRADGINPGAWDTKSRLEILIELLFSSISEDLSSVGMIVADAGGLIDGEGGDEGFVLLAENVSQGDKISFEVPKGKDFKIVGSVVGEDDFSISIDPGALQGNGDTANLTVEKMDFQTGTVTQFGNVNGVVTAEQVIEPPKLANQGNILEGTSGDDTLTGGSAEDSILGNGGNDQLVAGDSNDYVSGGSGNDFIRGDDGNDVLIGGGGNDSIFAGGADTGDDIIYGNAGNDTLGGGAGADQIFGGLGADTSFGGFGDDIISEKDTDFSSNIIWAGPGIDVVTGGNGNDVLGGGLSDDTISGGAGNDTIYSGMGDFVDVVYAGGGNDTVFSGNGQDMAFGGFGKDTIFNGGGNDDVFGGGGADILWGGGGNDNLSGGTEADVFSFVNGNGTDTILDFEVGIDKIEFDADGNTVQKIEVGSDVEISFGTTTVKVLGVTLSDINSSIELL